MNSSTKPICRVTHAQISLGPCPWCIQTRVIADERPRTWDVARMREDILCADFEVVSITSVNLSTFDVPFWSAVDVLEAYLAARAPVLEALVSNVRLGQGLPQDALEYLKTENPQLEGCPAFLCAILGYAFAKRFLEIDARTVYRKALFELIRTHPRLAIHQMPEARFDRRLEKADFIIGDQLWKENETQYPNDLLVIRHAKLYREQSSGEGLFD